MKLELHNNILLSLNMINAYDDSYVEINKIKFTYSVIVTPNSPIIKWYVNSTNFLKKNHFHDLVQLSPDILLIGVNSKLKCRLIELQLFIKTFKYNFSIEIMNLGAACRTYNILVDELRHVVLALLID